MTNSFLFYQTQKSSLLLRFRQVCYTQPVRTLFLFKSIWIRPQGSQGCQKIRIFFSQRKLLSFCANIAPKKHKLQKTIKIEKNVKKTPCFLRLFCIFFILGTILAHQTSNIVFSEPWPTFWHPRDPWGRIHIEYIKVLVFVFTISECWRPLQLFST